MAKDGYFTILILFTLLLDLASSLYISQDSLIKNVGDAFIVICKDKIRGQQVTWRDPNGNKLGPKTRPKVQNSSFGTAIMFNSAKEEDTGTYTCTTNGVPSERAVFSLRVEDDLQFVDTNKTQYLTEGDNGTLRCEVNKLHATISWLFENGEPINESLLVNNASKYQRIADGLLIRNVTREDSRVYTCQALHRSTGSVKAQDIKVIIKHKPYAYAREDVIYAFQDETVNLTCEVEAEPPPHFKWTGTGLKKSKIFGESAYKSVLMLNMTEDTQGTYNCTAKNTEGGVTIYFTLLLALKPEPPENITLTETKGTSLQLEITVPEVSEDLRKNGMEPNILVVEYRRPSEDEWSKEEFNITAVTSVQVLLTDLKKNSQYEIQAATKNVGGLSDYISGLFTTSTAPRSVQLTLPIISLILVNLSISLTSRLWRA